MATLNNEENLNNNNMKNITVEDIKLIIMKYTENKMAEVTNYSVYKASDKMLGFLAEYWKVKVDLLNRKSYSFFIKAISRTNIAKAEMVREMKLFDKEARFYLELKRLMEVPNMEPWSAQLVTVLHDALVFEDLNAMQYKIRNKFERFDMAHTMQALKTLARFHASSIIFEENRRKEANCFYKIEDDFEHILHTGGYHIACDWYIQCMKGAIEAMKMFSKYNEAELNIIDRQWSDIWYSALKINDCDSKQRKVICHRDLWNNNIMFHYEKGFENELVPDNCLLVDFQAVRCQPPASDVMLLLCCNLEPNFRQKYINEFLNFYYKELQGYLNNYNIQIDSIMTKENFLISAEEETKWGLVVCGCLIPQFWIDENLTTTLFSDNKQFEEILCKNKGLFIKKMMQTNMDYRYKVIEIFEEIADKYCFNINKKNLND